MAVKTLKFGGTSMANAECILQVRSIIERDEQAKYVVVSAPGKREKSDVKVTDLLIRLYEEKNVAEKRKIMDVIVERFDEIVKGLEIDLDLTQDLNAIFANVVGGASYDYTVSRGEFLSAKVLARLLGYKFVDSADFVRFKGGALDTDKTQALASKVLSGVEKAVVPGFYGTDDNGEIKAFSRGGSDISGAIVARAVHASVYENWTDVDGFMVCDPRVVEGAKVIDLLTYRELRELSYMGATVLHPEAVFPVTLAGIPINIRNTFNPDAKGTFIVKYEDLMRGKYERNNGVITGIAGKKHFTGIFIEKQMLNNEVGFCKALLDVLYDNDVSLEHMPTSIDTVTLVIDPTNDETLADVVAGIKDKSAPTTIEVDKGLSLIAVVGHGMSRAKGTAMRVCNALYNADVNIRMIDQGSSEMNIIIAVEDCDYEKAIVALYKEFIK